MNTQIAFIHNDEKFYTFQNCSYIQNSLPDTNVIRQTDLLGKTSYQTDFNRHNNGKNFKFTPIADVESVEVTGKYYHVKGTVVIDDVKYEVELTREALTFNPIEGDKVVTEEVPVPIEESESVNTTVVEPVSETDTEPALDDEIIEEVVKDTVEAATVASQSIIPKEVTQSSCVTQACRDNVMETLARKLTIGVHKDSSVTLACQPKPKAIEQPIGPARGTKNRLEFKEKLMPTHGIVFGRRETTDSVDIEMGVTDEPKSGISFGQRVLPRNATRRNLRNEALRQQAVQAQLNKEKNDEAERLQSAWAHPMPAKQRFSSLRPVPTAFDPSPVQEQTVAVDTTEEVEVASKTAREEAKAAVRKELPDDINKVLGDIPVDLLGNIAEFTMEPINSVEVMNGKEMFCIDRRWHKQGKWFCIDVVPNTSRYFFNSRLGVNIEIPINILKAWKEALDS